jgi:hypothetical protein
MSGRDLYSISFEIGCATPSLNVLKRMHFRAEAKLQQRFCGLANMATVGRRPSAPLARAAVTIERHCTGTLDKDNLYGGAKPLVDVLLTPRLLTIRNGKPLVLHKRGLGFLQDDSPDRLELTVCQVKAKRGQPQRTVITITELPAAQPAAAKHASRDATLAESNPSAATAQSRCLTGGALAAPGLTSAGAAQPEQGYVANV